LQQVQWPQAALGSPNVQVRIVTNCFESRYTLEANGLQMAVLLKYNDSTSYTAKQLSEAKGITMDRLLQVSKPSDIPRAGRNSRI
jgi:hypothetical protein